MRFRRRKVHRKRWSLHWFVNHWKNKVINWLAVILVSNYAAGRRYRYQHLSKGFLFDMFQSMLRGRGGCYKHTFYGIESHRCMETTPSLACANKCVFCWRLVTMYWVSILCLTFRGLIDIIVIQWERPGNGKRMMPKLWFKEQSTIIIKWSIPSKVYQVYYRVDWQKVRWYSSLVHRSMNSSR